MKQIPTTGEILLDSLMAHRTFGAPAVGGANGIFDLDLVAVGVLEGAKILDLERLLDVE